MTIAIVGAVTLVRILALFLAHLELYPDEAQYWLWSRHLDFGYFSKPPMVAWLIRATTAVGGDGEAWIRLSAPLLHAAAAVALAKAGERLYGARTGMWAAIFYTLIPGVQLSSAVMTTDAPLLCLMAFSVWAYAVWWSAESEDERRRAALAFGAAIGAGVLTKYAALYIAGGAALHALGDPEVRARWTPRTLAQAVGAALIVASPNLIWNGLHHFQTVAHTADNADLGGADLGLKGLFGPRGPFGFLFGQLWVFGPVPFVVLALGAWRTRRPDSPPADRLLIWLAAPALVIVFAEAVISRANANWAAVSYVPGAVLVAALFERWRMARWRAAAIATQALIAIGFLACVLDPGFADAIKIGAGFKRARGWAASAAGVVTASSDAARTRPLSAIAVDDRFLFNALAYYARGADGRPAGALPAPLRMWVHLAHPSNQAETEQPLDTAHGARVLAVSATPAYLDALKADFTVTTMIGHVQAPLDPKHDRRLDLFIGEGFQPRPRDSVTGRPIGR